MQQHFEALLRNTTQVEQKHNADPNGLKRYADADAKLLPPRQTAARGFSRRFHHRMPGGSMNISPAGISSIAASAGRPPPDAGAVPSGRGSLNPKVVVVAGGTNDIAAGIASNQIEDNLATMGDLAKAHGIKVIFASILPVSDYHKDADPHFERTVNRPPAAIQSINTWMQDLLPESGIRLHGLLRVHGRCSGQDAVGTFR